MEPSLLLTNARILDPLVEKAAEPRHILILGERIASIAADDPPTADRVVDVDGRYVLPGLIDCHVHPCLADANIARLDTVPQTLMTARAANILSAMLRRGFTSVRDAAGADWGVQQAIEDGHLVGPRIFISGRALSQTGGHGDFRRRTDMSHACPCAHALAVTSLVADGCDEVRKAVREQFRAGANQIKLMVSGGVSSPFDPLEADQYTPAEIETAVEEARRRGSYVMAHAYGASAIKTALEAGVRSIEHGNLIDEEGALLAADKGAFLVPTLITYTTMGDGAAAAAGWSTSMIAKLERVQEAGLESVRLCKRAGVKLGFGTDLLGDNFHRQSEEFLIRSAVESPRDIICSATRINAQILQKEGELGEISVGALADLLVLDGDPFADLSVLQDQGAHMSIIMKGGRIHKNTLAEEGQ